MAFSLSFTVWKILFDQNLLFGNNFSMNIQTEIHRMLAESGWTQKRLAQEAGINASALSKFMSREGESIPERVFPFVFGDKRPPARGKTSSQTGDVHESPPPFSAVDQPEARA